MDYDKRRVEWLEYSAIIIQGVVGMSEAIL